VRRVTRNIAAIRFDSTFVLIVKGINSPRCTSISSCSWETYKKQDSSYRIMNKKINRVIVYMYHGSRLIV